VLTGWARRAFASPAAEGKTAALLQAAATSIAPARTKTPRLQRAAQRALDRKQVRVISDAQAVKIDKRGLHLDDRRVIEAATVVWGAGVRAAPLAEQLKLELGSHKRIAVAATLQVPDHPEVLAIGDVAEIPANNHASLPMLALVAIQSGEHAAKVIEAAVKGIPAPPFRYHDVRTMATQGQNAAVAEIGPFKLSGFIGWLAWLFVHIARIVGLRTRLLVLINWIAGHLLVDRAVRLITGPAPSYEPAEQDDREAA
jgi:NADH dehydrogenase